MYHVGSPAPGSSQPAAGHPPQHGGGTFPSNGDGTAQPPVASPLSILWRRKWLMLLMGLLGAAAAIGIGSLIPPRYTAITQLLIDPSELRVVNNGLRNSSPFNEALIAEVETQTRVLLSTKVLRKVIKAERLADDPEFTSQMALNPIDHVRNFLKAYGLSGEAESGPPDPELDALRSLDKRVWARREERTFVVNLGAWTSDREKSVRIVNAIVKAFLEEQMGSTANSARIASSSLGDRLEGLRDRVEVAERAVDEFRRSNNILSSSGELVNEQQLTAVSGQLIQARTRRAEAESRFRQIQQIRRSGGDIGSIPEATASPTLAALRGQMAAAQRREAELSAQLLPRHPVVRQAREEVARLRSQVNAETGRIADAVSRDLQRAKGAEKTLQATVEQLKTQLTSINSKQVKLRELERDAEANRKVYEAFLLRTQEITQQEKIEVPKTRVISAAELPEHKSMPPSKVVLAAGGFGAGTAFGGVLALLLHALAGAAPAHRAPAQNNSNTPPTQGSGPNSEPAANKASQANSEPADNLAAKAPPPLKGETLSSTPQPDATRHPRPVASQETAKANQQAAKATAMAAAASAAAAAATTVPPETADAATPREKLFRRAPRLKTEPSNPARDAAKSGQDRPVQGPTLPAWL